MHREGEKPSRAPETDIAVGKAGNEAKEENFIESEEMMEHETGFSDNFMYRLSHLGMCL
jgi:hypothetical protein